MDNTQPSKNPFLDPSLWFLMISNLFAIFLAQVQHWDLIAVMWVYWFQSITIGFFNFIRMLRLKEFSTENFEMNNHPVEPTRKTKIETAFFFLIHYGGFHLVYLVFLNSNEAMSIYNSGFDIGEFKYIILTAILFFLNHLFSYIYNAPKDTKKQNIGNLMFYPYLRIIPMHLTIVCGSSFGSGPLIYFLLLKTVADAGMHLIEHNVLRKGEEQAVQSV